MPIPELLPDVGAAVGGPLVAAPVSVSSPFDGLWLVQDGMSLANGIANGDWVEGGLAAFSLLLDGVAALIDPIGTLIGMGLSWVLEHIWPLNEYLNALTGNAGEVLRMSQTWANISAHLSGAGGELDRLLGGLEALEGAAMDAYRNFQHDVAEHIALAGTLASATSAALEIASTIVKIVHDVTRDVISQIAGTAISAALTTVVTVGFGAPVAIAQVAARVSALVPKVVRAIEALLRSFDKLAPLLAKVDEINAAIKRVLDRILGGGSGAPAHGGDSLASARPPSRDGMPPDRSGEGDAPPVLAGGDGVPSGRPDDGDPASPGGGSRPPSDPDDPGWHPRMDPGRGNNPDGSWDGRPGHHLDPADNAVVQQYAAESVGIEQRLTPELQRIVADAAPGSRLVGGTDAIKFADSLKDKVAGMLAEDIDLTVGEALLVVKDSVRYTVESTVGEYSSTVVRTAERLQSEGYELVKFSDTWGSPGYKGVNSSWVDPASGRVFEVQFHTAESFVHKTESHGDYELLRDATLGVEDRARITRAIEEWFADLEVPPGVGNLDELFKPGGLPEGMRR